MDGFVDSVHNFFTQPFTNDIDLTKLLLIFVILSVVAWIVWDIMNTIAEGAIP